MHASVIDDMEGLQLTVRLLVFLSFQRMADIEIFLANAQALESWMGFQMVYVFVIDDVDVKDVEILLENG